MRERVSEVTRELVLVPTGREITQYEGFRRELALASAVLSHSPLSHSPPGAVLSRSPPGARDSAFPLAGRSGPPPAPSSLGRFAPSLLGPLAGARPFGSRESPLGG